MKKQTKFITKNDPFGIRQLLKQVFPKVNSERLEEDFCFNIFVNQFLPPTFYETKSTVIRHLDEIRNIYSTKYRTDWVWIKRNNQMSCAIINDPLMLQIKDKTVELPTYMEIEEEKKKWQSQPNYNKEEGFSDPIKEEFVQLVFRKGVK